MCNWAGPSLAFTMHIAMSAEVCREGREPWISAESGRLANEVWDSAFQACDNDMTRCTVQVINDVFAWCYNRHFGRQQ
jgi:hypothetical protein